MARKLIIFGNGVGMATDPNHFSLANAMADVWNMPGLFTEEQKHLISRCTGVPGSAPNSEDQLDTLHQAVGACRTLNDIAPGDIHWLSQDGQQFPEAISRYLHKVAIRLHNYEGNINEEFFLHLSNYIKQTKSHVATLNYDRLLYSYFIDSGVLSGYGGCLVDGIVGAGFDANNLIRRYGRTFGYYLHLHGSPLFLDHLGTIYKLGRHQLSLNMARHSSHIVLTHVKHKISVINQSPILEVYWQYLQASITECEEIILFGYSGLDNHLNILLTSLSQNKKIKVIEWIGAGDSATRAFFWRTTLGFDIDLTQLDNITDFRNW
jgi:hypothetical protein